MDYKDKFWVVPFQININNNFIDIKSALREVCLRSDLDVVNETSFRSSFIHEALVTSQPSVSEGGTTPRKGGGCPECSPHWWDETG